MALYYVPFPLARIHRFAEPAAKAAECADQQGRFVAIEALLYAKQDSFGLKSWASYAHEVGVPDTSRFTACTQSNAKVGRLEASRELASRLQATATPTVIVNGWRYPVPPDSAELVRIVDSLIRGRGRAADRP